MATQPPVGPEGDSPTQASGQSAPAADRRQAVVAAARGAPPPSPKQQAERLVYTWPHLVLIEFIAAMLLLLSLLIMGWVINAPLLGHANLDKTPNPSKAPWYFLNLQELLLHMHPALAGVIIPGAVVFTLLPAIPYIDRSQADIGKWFGSRNAKPIAIFSAIWTALLLPIMLVLDEEQTCSSIGLGEKQVFIGEKGYNLCGLKNFFTFLSDFLEMPLLSDVVVAGILVPMAIMTIPIFVLIFIIRRRWQADTRGVMIALFTGFVVSYFVLTISGSFFRGRGMHLYAPWDPRIEIVE